MLRRMIEGEVTENSDGNVTLNYRTVKGVRRMGLGGYSTVYDRMEDLLVRKVMQPAVYTLSIQLSRKMDKRNMLYMTDKQLAEDIGVSVDHMKHMMNELVQLRIIVRVGRGKLMFNPMMRFKVGFKDWPPLFDAWEDACIKRDAKRSKGELPPTTDTELYVDNTA